MNVVEAFICTEPVYLLDCMLCPTQVALVLAPSSLVFGFCYTMLCDIERLEIPDFSQNAALHRYALRTINSHILNQFLFLFLPMLLFGIRYIHSSFFYLLQIKCSKFSWKCSQIAAIISMMDSFSPLSYLFLPLNISI